jgi:hypothetical protein
MCWCSTRAANDSALTRQVSLCLRVDVIPWAKGPCARMMSKVLQFYTNHLLRCFGKGAPSAVLSGHASHGGHGRVGDASQGRRSFCGTGDGDISSTRVSQLREQALPRYLQQSHR